MSLIQSPKSVTDSLKLYFDTSNLKSIKPMGVNSPTVENFYDMITGNVITSFNHPYVVGKTYFTCVGCQYPESNSPAPWTSRDGITSGINNTTDSKVYDATRDLGMYVWNDDTNDWVSDSFFNGERENGHVYDTYNYTISAAQHLIFQQDYDYIKKIFPNVTIIILGSHAAENNDNDAETVKRLKELGLPDSHIGVSRPEYILVGKPNKRNTQFYVRENVDSITAVLNVGLPLEGIFGGVLFNGVDQYMTINSPLTKQYDWSIECVIKVNNFGNSPIFLCPSSNGIDQYLRFDSNGSLVFKLASAADSGQRSYTSNYRVSLDEYVHVTFVRTTSKAQIYINGNIDIDATDTSVSGTWSGSWRIGQRGNGTYYFNGEIPILKAYEKSLTSKEVKQNFNSIRGRFSL